MRKRLNNVRSKDGYRQFCSSCGKLCITTDFPVYGDRRAFCDKACYREFYSAANLLYTLGMVVGYPVATAGPFVALFKVSQYYSGSGYGLLVGIGAFALTCLLVSAPIYKVLNR